MDEIVGAIAGAMGVIVLVGVLVALASAIAVAICGRACGRSGWGWFFVAVLFTPPVALLMLIAVGPRPRLPG